MNVLVATDAFPPICGGSGWSTFELARTLRGRGHDLLIVRPMPGAASGVRETRYEGLAVHEFGFAAPNVPYVRNYFKSEYLTRVLGDYSVGVAARAAVRPRTRATRHDGGSGHSRRQPHRHPRRRHGARLLARLLLVGPDPHAGRLELCPECTTGNMTQCIRPRAGAAWPLALPLIPYMRANLAEKRTTLARANAVVAVSHQIAMDL